MPLGAGRTLVGITESRPVVPCAKCGLAHEPGELFVPAAVVGRCMLVYEDTCELEPAWRQAHAAVQPPGAVAYHATDHLVPVLNHRIDPTASGLKCKHVCLAETAEIAAGVDVGDVVLEVDVSGLDLFLEMGEARHHGAPIEPTNDHQCPRHESASRDR